MNVLVDTNVLLRSMQPGNPHFQVASDAIVQLRSLHRLCIVPQNLYELWAVCTRPVAVNGIGMSAKEAEAELAKIRSLFTLLADNASIYEEWHRLVVGHAVLGKNAHDARLVAAMVVHGVTHLMTFNIADFARYPRIQIIDPAVAARAVPP